MYKKIIMKKTRKSVSFFFFSKILNKKNRVFDILSKIKKPTSLFWVIKQLNEINETIKKIKTTIFFEWRVNLTITFFRITYHYLEFNPSIQTYNQIQMVMLWILQSLCIYLIHQCKRHLIVCYLYCPLMQRAYSVTIEILF